MLDFYSCSESFASLFFQLFLRLNGFGIAVHPETVRRFLPFFLLLASTLRPPFVDILFLNPWAFALLRFDG
jgi:hypothetical protein